MYFTELFFKELNMKPFNPIIPDYTPHGQKKVEEETLTLKPCCICSKVITTGYFGRWGDGGTCTAKCEGIRQDMQLYLREVP